MSTQPNVIVVTTASGFHQLKASKWQAADGTLFVYDGSETVGEFPPGAWSGVTFRYAVADDA